MVDVTVAGNSKYVGAALKVVFVESSRTDNVSGVTYGWRRCMIFSGCTDSPASSSSLPLIGELQET